MTGSGDIIPVVIFKLLSLGVGVSHPYQLANGFWPFSVEFFVERLAMVEAVDERDDDVAISGVGQFGL